MTSSQTPPRIALISATPAAIPPALAGLAADFPEAVPWNILDDRLLADVDAAGGLTEALRARMLRLIDHALEEGAAGVLLTCSQYGPIATAVAAAVPVLAPDEAAFRAVLDGAGERVLVLASIDSSMRDSVERLRAQAEAEGRGVRVFGVTAPEALAAGGDTEALVASLAAAVAPRAAEADTILLAQFSLAPATEALERLTGLPVVSGPQAAAVALRSRITGA